MGRPKSLPYWDRLLYNFYTHIKCACVDTSYDTDGKVCASTLLIYKISLKKIRLVEYCCEIIDLEMNVSVFY